MMSTDSIPTASDLQAKIKQTLVKATLSTRYQKILIVFCCFNQMLVCFTYMIGSFVFMNPLFQCSGEPATEEQACVDISRCVITNNFTATFYSGLYCQKQFMRSSIQSVFFVGLLSGMIILASMSDKKGRKYVFLLTYGIQLVAVTCIIVGIYCNLMYLCLVGQFLAGFFMTNTDIAGYIMTTQHCSNSMRQHALMFYCAAWAFSEMSFFLLYNFMPWWDYYLILVVLIPTIGGLALVSFLLIQSPYYQLFMAKDYDLFEDALHSLQFYNKYDQQLLKQVKVKARQFIQFKHLHEHNKQSVIQSLKNLWNSKKHLVYSICLVFLGIGFSMYYYGMQLTMERTGFNFGTSMLLAGGYQFLGYISANFFIEKIPRKKGLFIIVVLSSAVGLCFLLPFVKASQIIQSIGQCLIRALSTYNYSLLAQLQTQSFPLQLLAIAVGIAEGGSELGNIIVPYLVDQFNNTSIHPLVAAVILYLVFSLVALVGLKETLKSSKNNPNEEISKDTESIQQGQDYQINKESLLVQNNTDTQE